MTELERRALLGDRQAQEKCTQMGIVIRCPVCGNTGHIENNGIKEKRHNSPESCADYHTDWKVRCDWCGHESHTRTTEFYFNRFSGEIKISGTDGKVSALKEWNTRPAPPFGRCGECANACNTGDDIVTCDIFERDMMPDDFCSQFEPKQGGD